MLEVTHDREDMVQALLSCQADVNLQDHDGLWALRLACHHGNGGLVRLLLAHPACDSSLTDKGGQTAQMLGVTHDQEDMVQALLSCQADFKLQDHEGLWALMLACHHGNANLVCLLLTHPAWYSSLTDKTRLMDSSQGGHTALMLGINQDQEDMVHVLLSCQAEVNLQDHNGLWALMLACHLGNADLVRLLLAHQACDSSLTDKYGEHIDNDNDDDDNDDKEN
ncbi:KN motif and ankyrin repeat domain-containing protein 4-like [Urocitellus parryii]